MFQDVFLKMILTRYSGFGYGFILERFAPRLKGHSMDQRTIDHILIENPRRVFSVQHRGP
jgi:phosphotriesterase-related protein